MSIRQEKAHLYGVSDTTITLTMQKYGLTDKHLEQGVIERQSDMYFEIWNFAHDAYFALCDTIGKKKMQRIVASATNTKTANWSVWFFEHLFSKTDALIKIPSKKLVLFAQLAYYLIKKLKKDGYDIQLEYSGQLYKRITL